MTQRNYAQFLSERRAACLSGRSRRGKHPARSRPVPESGALADDSKAYEYGTVRKHDTVPSIPARTEMDFFDGPHTIYEAAFDFLHRHLRRPKRE